jgi:CRISPR/Cas system-associated exonuclease Cas4 (RecB family)
MGAKLFPQVARLSPTKLGDWSWCPRRFLLRHVLGVPESDAGPSSDQGRLVHDLLRHIHTTGTCHDHDLVAEALAGHGGDDAVRVMIDRHRQRCPRDHDGQFHEQSRARYHHRPVPMFLATARIDAAWIHDGVLDVRDYKTGAPASGELRDDIRAQVQAWVCASAAAERGLRLRLRYEYLAPEIDDDPEPWEPDDDDLEAVAERLRAVVTDMRASEFSGVHEEPACRPCPYRSVCPDSAAAGIASWPVLTVAGSHDAAPLS